MCSSLFRKLIIGALLVLLAACSTLRLGYNQGPTLAYWWADRYVDFDDRQESSVRLALNDWFRWHRTTQLDDLNGLLQKAQIQAVAPASAAQVCRWVDELSARLMLAYDHAVPAMADLALSVRPEQLAKLEKRYEKNNRDFADDYLQATSQDRLQASVKRAVKRAEDFYGRISDDQRAMIERRTAASPLDAQLWLAERRARQQDILASLRRWTSERSSPELVRADLKRLAQGVRSSSREPYRLYQQRLFDYNCTSVADFHNATTSAQRQRLASKLKGWETDIRALMLDVDP